MDPALGVGVVVPREGSSSQERWTGFMLRQPVLRGVRLAPSLMADWLRPGRPGHSTREVHLRAGAGVLREPSRPRLLILDLSRAFAGLGFSELGSDETGGAVEKCYVRGAFSLRHFILANAPVAVDPCQRLSANL